MLPGSNEAYAVGDNSYGQLGAGHNQVELGEGEGDSSGSTLLKRCPGHVEDHMFHMLFAKVMTVDMIFHEDLRISCLPIQRCAFQSFQKRANHFISVPQLIMFITNSRASFLCKEGNQSFTMNSHRDPRGKSKQPHLCFV